MRQQRSPYFNGLHGESTKAYQITNLKISRVIQSARVLKHATNRHQMRKSRNHVTRGRARTRSPDGADI